MAGCSQRVFRALSNPNLVDYTHCPDMGGFGLNVSKSKGFFGTLAQDRFSSVQVRPCQETEAWREELEGKLNFPDKFSGSEAAPPAQQVPQAALQSPAGSVSASPC